MHCWAKARGDKKVQAIEGVQPPGDAAPKVETVLKEVYAFERQSWENDSPKSEDRWILAFGDGDAPVEYETVDKEVSKEWLMLDSGAAEHVCPRWWHDDGAIRPVIDSSALRDVQGQAIEQHGLRTVKCDVLDDTEEEPTKVAINFTVTDVKEPIVSMVKLCEAGARVILQRDASWVEFDKKYYELKYYRGRVFMGVIAGVNRHFSKGIRREVAAQSIPEDFEWEGAGGATSSASGAVPPPPGLDLPPPLAQE